MEGNKRAKSFRNNKGITLIALIVTIVILLILVGTGLKVLVDDKAVNRAEDAVGKANNRVGAEQGILDEALGEWGILTQGGCSHEGEWITTKEATCTEIGTMTRTCTKCGATQTLQIAKASHTYGEWTTTKEATCTETGTKSATCIICGNVILQEISATGHNYEKTEGAGCRVDVDTEYSDGEKTAIIPAGFTISGISTEQTIDGGLVIYLIDDMTDSEIEAIDWTNATTVASLQQTYDQFVWIPVDNINDMYMCQNEDGTKSCNIKVANGEAYCTTHSSNQMAGRLYLYESNTDIYYDASMTTQTYTSGEGVREPDLGEYATQLEGFEDYVSQILGKSYTSYSDVRTDTQSEYNEIVESVYQNDGFYIGRYETSNITTTDGDEINIVSGATVGDYITGGWYTTYAQHRDYAVNKGITSNVGSSMIQSAAYDQVMRFVNGALDGTGEVYDVTQYSLARHVYSSMGVTGAVLADKVKNIYDLEGNIAIATLGLHDSDTTSSAGYSTYVPYHVLRGSGAIPGTASPASSASSNNSTGYNSSICQLYITGSVENEIKLQTRSLLSMWQSM